MHTHWLVSLSLACTDRDPKPDDILETRPLQPFHTHFVFFGGRTFDEENENPSEFPEDMIMKRTARVYEGELTSHLEKDVANFMVGELGQERGPPRVLLLVGGDAASLGEVIAFNASGGFIVVAQDTGGLAAAISSYMAGHKLPLEWRAHEEAFRALCPPEAGGRKSTIGQQAFSRCRVECTNTQKKDAIFNAIQTAVMTQLSPVGGTDERVEMAVAWGDAAALKAELHHIPIWDERRGEVLAKVLQQALDCQEVECVRVALHNGAPAKDVDLCDLYWTKLFDTSNPPQFYLFEGISRPKEDDGVRKTGILKEGDVSGWEDYFPPAVWELLGQTVPGLVKYWKNKLKKAALRKSGEYVEKSPSPLKRGSDGGLTSDASYKELLKDVNKTKTKSTKVGCRVVDLYVWAVLLGNTEMALTMLPFVQEPMRAAIIGARLCGNMAERLPLHAKKLEEAKEQHEDFAIELLDLCETFGEARRMLTTKSKHWNRTVLDLAVQSDLLRFCENRFCQLLCDEMARGSMDFGTSTVLDNSLNIGKAGLSGAINIIMHGVLPVPWPGILYEVGVMDKDPEYPDDSMYAIGWVKRQTAFVTEKEKEQDRKDGRREVLTIAKYYQIPLVRQLLRLFSYVCFVMLYSYTVIHPNVVGYYDVASKKSMFILFVWTLALAFDEWAKWASDAATFDFDFWKKYDWSVIGLTLLSMALGLIEPEWTYEGLEIVSILTWCRLLKFLMLSQPIGVLTIMIMEMVGDIMLWMLVALVFTAAFTVAFLATSNSELTAVAIMPLWAMLGSYDVEQVKTWSPKAGEAMLWLFIIVSNILLVNLLIAMMGDTFSRIKENSDAKWKIGRLRSIQEAVKQMHPVPPPVNLPLTLSHFIKNKGQRDDVQAKTPEEEARIAADWSVGGKLWEAKREKDRVARALLSKLTKKRAEEEADAERARGVDQRVQNVESLLETLSANVEALLADNERTSRAASPVKKGLGSSQDLPPGKGGAPSAGAPSQR